jgi:hypothetical protein
MSTTILDNGYLGNKFLRDKTSEFIIAGMKTATHATKVIAVQSVSKASNDVKVVVSSFWLNLFNFFEGDEVVETPIGKNQGFDIRPAALDDTGTKKVYGRNYPQRKTNKREPVMDIRNQTKLNLSIGSAKSVRIIFKKNLLTVLPIFSGEQQARSEALDITLPKDNGLYYGVIAAVKILKEHLFTEFTIASDEEFANSREFTLLTIQVRRLGYEINVVDGLITGRLGTKSILKRHSIDVSMSKLTNRPLRFDRSNPLTTTGVCTSGVDICAAQDDGFSTLNVLDYRPIEMRDLKSKQDRSETGAICAAFNTKSIKTIFNECIYGMDTVLMRDLMRPTNFLSLSLQCSDYSTVKNAKDKAKAIANLTTTIDMFFPVLDIIENNNFSCLLTENVHNFANSVESKLFVRHLESLGYIVQKSILNAEQYNGFTQRSRSYIFATKLTSHFSWPEVESRTVNAWHDIVIPNIDEFRNVNHTGGIETMLKGKALVESGMDVSTMTKAQKTIVRKFRSRNIITENKHVAGTILRSQSKQVAESLYAKQGDQYLLPSNKVLKAFMGIKESFDVSMFTAETGSELIGQSVDVKMHHRISQEIKKHIMIYVKSLKTKVNRSLKQSRQLVLI